MAAKRSNTFYLLVVAVVFETLALIALAIALVGGPGRPPSPGGAETVPPDGAVPPGGTVPPGGADFTPPNPLEIVVPVVVFDTDALATAVAEKVESKTAEKLEIRIRALRLNTPATPVAKPPADKGGGKATTLREPAEKPAEKPDIPDAPKMPPPPEGSYVTTFGAQPATGPEDAPVLVFIMSDFQCPVCKRAAEGLKPLLTEFEDVRWVFWNNPLDMHSRARAAAAASMAAFRQGKFWEYHDLLFENSRALQDGDLEQYAKDLGLDMEKFKGDLGDEALNFQFDANMRVATMLEARGTPSFVINGRKQVGWGSAGGVRSMVQREVDAAKALVASGKTPAQAREERAKENAKTPEDLSTYLAHMLKGKIPPTSE